MGAATLDMAGNGISIDASTAPGAFTGIRVRAKSGAADIIRVQVIYDGGAVHNEDRAIKLGPGERTRAVDEGTPRFIDKINIINAPGKGTAEIEVLGIQPMKAARLKRDGALTGDLSAEATSSEPTSQGPGTSGADNDVLFGYQNVGFAIDRDVIKVGGDLGKFDRIRLRVLGNDVHINTLTVAYMDSSTSELAVNAEVKANSFTPWFDLKREFIREIAMSYRSRPNFKGQARVEVVGQYAEGWLGASGEGRKFNNGWVMLGSQTAGFTGFDRDLITVGKNEGGFKSLRIEAKERAITLREIRVKYFEGPDEVFTMNERVDPGKPYGPLVFKGGVAPIKSIEAKYRSRFDLWKGLKTALDGKPAVVFIWGQH